MKDNRKLYEHLGVPTTATDDEIRRAYKKLAREFHPDRNASPSAEARFKQIGNAYQVLSDAEKRKLYDEFGEMALQSGFDAKQAERVRQAQAYAQTAGRRPSPGAWQYGGAGGRDVSAFDLEELLRGFGGAGGGGGFGGFSGFDGAAHQGPPRRDRLDVQATVELDFVDAAKGAEMTLQIPQADEPGGVRHQRVRIPAGAEDGSVLRLRGQGTRRARRTGEVDKGDLLLTVRVRPHKLFNRDGLDLKLRLQVDLLDAYAGASVQVPTLEGSVKLTVPPCSQPGRKLRLRGKGVRRGKQRGDLIVELDLRMPERADPNVTAALRKARSHNSQSRQSSTAA